MNSKDRKVYTFYFDVKGRITDTKVSDKLPLSIAVSEEDCIRMMQSYLEAGGDADVVIQSRKDLDSNFKSAQIQLLERLMEQAKGKAVGVPVVPLSAIQGELDSLKGVK